MTAWSYHLALEAYRQGFFPMAKSRHADDFNWYDVNIRSLLPIENFHIPRKLRQLLRRSSFTVTVDQDFPAVLGGCAEPRRSESETWLNPGIRDMLTALYNEGHAHSIECWKDGMLAGGLYGIALGQVFSAESMFSKASGASKVALVHLCARLWAGGFHVLDTQFLNPHLIQFGAYEISREHYKKLLHHYCDGPADFRLPGLSEEKLLADYLKRRNLDKNLIIC